MIKELFLQFFTEHYVPFLETVQKEKHNEAHAFFVEFDKFDTNISNQYALHTSFVTRDLSWILEEDVYQKIFTFIDTVKTIDKWIRAPKNNKGIFQYTLSDFEVMDPFIRTKPLDFFASNNLTEENLPLQGGTTISLSRFEMGTDSSILQIESVVDTLSIHSVKGKDISSEFRFNGDDLLIVEEDRCIMQQLQNLFQLKKKTIPSLPEIGISVELIGGNRNEIFIPILIKNIVQTVLSDDFFSKVEVSSMSIKEDALSIELLVYSKIKGLQYNFTMNI